MRSRPDLSLRPWRAGDEEAFTPRRDFAEERAAVAWSWGKGPPPGRTWTLLRGEEVLGIGGVITREEWSECWACLADLPRRDWPQAVEMARRALVFVLTHHRPPAGLFATCRADNAGALLVLGRLGFSPEALRADPRTPGVEYLCLTRRTG